MRLASQTNCNLNLNLIVKFTKKKIVLLVWSICKGVAYFYLIELVVSAEVDSSRVEGRYNLFSYEDEKFRLSISSANDLIDCRWSRDV